jgi:hypothetical protein
MSSDTSPILSRELDTVMGRLLVLSLALDFASKKETSNLKVSGKTIFGKLL